MSEDDANENARAQAFGQKVDALLDGAAPPPAMPTDEREMIETATMIHAAGHPRSAPTRALDRAFAARPAAANVPKAARPRRRWLRAAPWAVAAVAVAAAALLLLLLRPPAPRPLPTALRSRPADALVGKIPPERAADARARIDAIYADRLAGYRELALFERRPR
jgi:hypothetical protein